MNPMLQKVALALKAANEKHYAVLKINVHDMTWEVWVEGKAAEVNFKNHSDAFARCETLNYEYAARKAVEALIDPSDKLLLTPGPPYRVQKAVYITVTEGIELRRKAWNSIINAILSCHTS